MRHPHKKLLERLGLTIGPYLRRRLLSYAHGRVLELACGSGKNLEYYPDIPGGVTELVAFDMDPQRLAIAKQFAETLSPTFRVQFQNIPAESAVFEAQSFDTIVSTLSLCAYDNPVQVLQHIKEFARPDAQFLFLEHGNSSNRYIRLIQRALDSWQHKARHCHLDRDIPSIIREAGLSIVESKRYIFGSVYFLRARQK